MLYEAIQNTEKCKCSSDSVSDTLYYEQSDAQDMHDESSRPLSLQTATGATKPTIDRLALYHLHSAYGRLCESEY